MDDNKTTVSCSCDDQGGGGVSCDSCQTFFYMKHLGPGDHCWNCGREVTNWPDIEPYPYGGSDF